MSKTLRPLILHHVIERRVYGQKSKGQRIRKKYYSAQR